LSLGFSQYHLCRLRSVLWPEACQALIQIDRMIKKKDIHYVG